MTKDEALLMALEALEYEADKGNDNAYQRERDAIKQALAAPVQNLPFGVSGGLVAIKTLLSRDPCVHANTAIEMIDAILKEHPAAKRQWVGLTDEEKRQIFEREDYQGWLDYINAIEAKLKERNNA